MSIEPAQTSPYCASSDNYQIGPILQGKVANAISHVTAATLRPRREVGRFLDLNFVCAGRFDQQVLQTLLGGIGRSRVSGDVNHFERGAGVGRKGDRHFQCVPAFRLEIDIAEDAPRLRVRTV